MVDKHMSVAEFKRHLSEVMAEIVHTKRRVVVERHGRPMVVVGPLDEVDTRTPGQRLADVPPLPEAVAEEFAEAMRDVLAARRDQAPRPAPEFEP